MSRSVLIPVLIVSYHQDVDPARPQTMANSPGSERYYHYYDYYYYYYYYDDYSKHE